LYNYAPANYLQTPLERYSGGLFLTYELGRSTETYIELTHTTSTATQNLAPVPAVGNNWLINTDNPILSPANAQFLSDNFFDASGAIPGINNLVAGPIRRRLLALGPRIIQSEDNYSRAVAGLRGDLSENWDFDFWVTYTKGEEKEFQLNSASRSRVQQGFLVDPLTGQCYDPTGGCVPVSFFGPGALTPEALDYIRVRPILNVTDRTQKLASFFVRGDLFNTWAGAVQTAFGLEWRSDEGGYKADDLLFTFDALGYNADATVIGSESVWEAYGEALIPLLEGVSLAQYLGLELGARYSEYEHAGKVDSFKIGADWQLNDTLRFRVMYQSSVRAPDLAEAFEEERISNGSYAPFDSSDDLCSASNDPVGNGNTDACIATGLPANLVGVFEAQIQFPTQFTSGGNTSLTPETAETVTAGVIISPQATPKWQFSFDYYDLNVEDEIGGINIDLACFDAANVDHLFCDRITRDSSPAGGYNVSAVDERTINKGVLRTSGVDTQITYATDLPDFLAIGNNSADLVVNSTWTHMLEKSGQNTAFSTVVDCAGYFGWPCNNSNNGNTWPTDRVTTTFNYASGNLNLHLMWQWIDEVKNSAPLGVDIFGYPEPVLATPKVSQRNYLDLGIGYQVTDNIIGRLSIANITGTNPVQMADAVQNNTDTSLYDVYGRSYTLSFSMHY
jgi:iron complex outermembrane recepter protein